MYFISYVKEARNYELPLVYFLPGVNYMVATNKYMGIEIKCPTGFSFTSNYVCAFTFDKYKNK